MITESQIKAAVRRVTVSDKKRPRIELKDDGERGAGRLALIARRLGDKVEDTVATEWYAVYYRDGKRLHSKIGSYPTLSSADARKKFREEYAPAISAGAEPESAAARRSHRKEAGKLGELFTAYVGSLRADGKRSADKVQSMLDDVAASIGEDRLAGSIEAKDVVPHLADIHDRGCRAMAKQVRAYVSAAFAFGMKAEHDYRQKSAGTRWGIKINPVAAIPADPDASPPRDRFLMPQEFRTLWLWLSEYETESLAASALKIVLATGQRIEEVLRITSTATDDPARGVYDQSKRMVYWGKTKTGVPHSIPLPPQVVETLDRLITNKYGIYFPNRRDARRFSLSESVGAVTDMFLKEHPKVSHFVPKDCRRTWKTLAGDAGVSKDMRDMLQNHKKGDISSRHYDRYSYLRERREAMAKWAAYLELVIAGEIKEIGQRESNVVPIGKMTTA